MICYYTFLTRGFANKKEVIRITTTLAKFSKHNGRAHRTLQFWWFNSFSICQNKLQARKTRVESAPAKPRPHASTRLNSQFQRLADFYCIIVHIIVERKASKILWYYSWYNLILQNILITLTNIRTLYIIYITILIYPWSCM